MTVFGIAAESEHDVRLITGLADRIVIDGVPWIESEEIGDYRSWAGTGDDAWMRISHATTLARDARLPIYGHFAGEPGALDAQMHRAALLLFYDRDPRPDAVIIARDVDGEEGRLAGFEQARKDRDWPFRVVGALAQPEIEAWLIAAWTPDTLDITALAHTRQELGFDPTTHSERLTSGESTDNKDAKRILELLSGADPSRAEEQWREADLERLRQRGQKNGLARFLTETEESLVPLLGAGSSPGPGRE